MSRPAITQATAGLPASTAWWKAQVFDPLTYLYNYAVQSVAFAAIMANTSTTTTTEQIAITTDPITFQNGRAYRITYKGLGGGSVTGDNGQFRVRETDTGGTAWLDSFRVYLFNGNTMFNLQTICTNTTGSDVTTTLVGTYVRAAGSGTVAVTASTNNVAYLHVEDIGLASNFPDATAIT